MTTTRRWPLTVALALVVALIAAGVAVVNLTRHDSSFREPTQPAPAYAHALEEQLEERPGVARVRAEEAIECIDGCKGHRYGFDVAIDLTDDATAANVRDAAAFVRSRYPEGAHPMAANIPASIHFFTAGLNASGDNSLAVTTSGPALTTAQAQAYLDVARTNPRTEARLLPDRAQPAAKATFVVESDVIATKCEDLDRVTAPTVAVLRKVAGTDGTSTHLTFRCAQTYATVAVGPTTWTHGWSDAATALSTLEATPQSSAAERPYVRLGVRDGATRLTVSARSDDAVSPETRRRAGVVIERLRTVGAVNPQLDLD